jgi:hypothetical protein
MVPQECPGTTDLFKPKRTLHYCGKLAVSRGYFIGLSGLRREADGERLRKAENLKDQKMMEASVATHSSV